MGNKVTKGDKKEIINEIATQMVNTLVKQELISKIIFLDVDGVLNNAKSDISELFIIENDLLELLKMIMKETGAFIVLSSTWRIYSGTRNKFERISGLNYNEYWISCTPNFGTNRVDEILWWLKENTDFEGPNNAEFNALNIDLSKTPNNLPVDLIKLQNKLEKVTFVAIDDMDFSKEGTNYSHIENNFVHIDKKVGITLEDAQKAIDILNKI